MKQKELKLQSPTEFLRTVEGMVKYLDKECEQPKSGKSVFCIAYDAASEKPAVIASSGDITLLAKSLAAATVINEAAFSLVQQTIDLLQKAAEKAEQQNTDDTCAS